MWIWDIQSCWDSEGYQHSFVSRKSNQWWDYSNFKLADLLTLILRSQWLYARIVCDGSISCLEGRIGGSVDWVNCKLFLLEKHLLIVKYVTETKIEIPHFSQANLSSHWICYNLTDLILYKHEFCNVTGRKRRSKLSW